MVVEAGSWILVSGADVMVQPHGVAKALLKGLAG
jgi:hypothetical protein